MQEIGVNWKRVSRHNQWKARASPHLDPNHTKSYMSYNTHDRTNQSTQWGGTGIMSYGVLAHHSAGAGSDRAKLGRWTWTKYLGKNGVVLRCVSIYRPCNSKQGTQSVYAQQRQYFLSKNEDKDPRATFLVDFEAELQDWLAQGDQIVVGGDMNDAVTSPIIKALFQRNGMINVIDTKHDLTNAPSTYNTGSRIIDGLWATVGLHVTACGYLAPGETVSDHSLLWMDVTFESALGHKPPFPATLKARKLRLYDSKTTKRYLDCYEQLVIDADLVQRQIRLKRSITPGTPLTPAQAQEADAIDTIKTTAMHKAEQKCRKLRMGAVAFSEATEAPKRRICFWVLAIKRREGRRVSSRLWRRKKKKAKIIESTREMTIDTMKANLKQARLEYRAAKKKHKEERVSFLDTLEAKDRNRLLRVEKQRELGRIAKAVTGKLGNFTVLKVDYQGHELSTRAEVERTLLKVNEAKMRATEDTPFMMEPLLSEFGYQSDTTATQQVLDGTYQCPPGTNRYAELLIQHLKRPEIPHDVQPFKPSESISLHNHEKGWKKAKERTAAGYSGLHFGMYKAHLKRPLLAALDTSMRSVAYQTGFCYKRWKKGVDVQLLKRSRDYRAEKLRTILLLEADFNMNNKALGGDIMRVGERHRWFTKDNYGGRKGHQAPEVSLNSKLVSDSIRGRRARAIIISNDAKGCYDRIAHTVLRLATGRLGIPDPAVASMVAGIQAMEHFICTAFGMSTETYGPDENRPPKQGMLQGNGAGPAGWFAISSVIIEAMKAQGFGLKDWSLIRKRAYEIGGFAFVDDTDLVHANPDPNVTTEALIEEAQQALNTWHGLIRATGGDLAPEKSYWYLVELHWKNGRWDYKTIDDCPGELYIPGCPDPIRRLNVQEATEALGIQSCPAGTSDAETAYLVNKVSVWTEAIRSKRVKMGEAWYCLNSTIMKTIQYPLLATTLSRKQIFDIMGPLLRVILNQIGIQKNLPRKLVYGTLRGRGLGLYELYWLQLIQHLLEILRQCHRDTPTSQLLDDNADLVQFYVGSEQNFWDMPFEQYGCLAPEGWTKHTWEALSQTPLSLRGPSLAVPIKRQHDIHLMDAFVDQGFSPAILKQLNEARLYLQAVTLADICLADGTSIDPYVWEGQRPLSRLTRTSDWISTRPLGPRLKDLWRRALRRTFLHPHHDHQRLLRPLGPWFATTDTHWRWWWHPATDVLYGLTDDGHWQRRRLHSRRGGRVKFQQATPITQGGVPNGIQRASVFQARNCTFMTLLGTGMGHDPVIGEVDTVTAALGQLPPSAQWAVRTVRISDNGDTVAAAIRNGTAVAVSDGSLKNNMGTSAFVLAGSTDSGYILGANKVPGHISTGDSHRCELSGIYGVVTTVAAIVDVHHITQGSVHMVCDNEQALRVFDPDFLPNPQGANFDLVNALWNLLKQSPLRWTAEHVRGHQDRKCRLRPYTRFERLNIAMDKLASNYWLHLLHTSPSMPDDTDIPILGEGWQLWNGSNKLTQPSIPKLYEHLQDNTTQMWWVRHNVLSPEARLEVDWDATSTMMTTIPAAERRYITKSASSNCGVGVTQVAWGFQADAACPRCGQTEDTTHVLRCTGQSAQEVWDKSMEALHKYMIDSHTSPDLRDMLETCLNKWRRNETIHFLQFPPDVQHILAQQKRIGWKQMIEGLAGSSWRTYQHRYYADQGLRKSSNKWIKGLLAHLVKLGRKQWLHRNDFKHNTGRPRQRRMETLLNQAIVRINLQGRSNVMTNDQHMFRWNICTLLRKSLPYRQSWLVNVLTAMNWRKRFFNNNLEVSVITPEQQELLDWIQTGRAT